MSTRSWKRSSLIYARAMWSRSCRMVPLAGFTKSFWRRSTVANNPCPLLPVFSGGNPHGRVSALLPSAFYPTAFCLLPTALLPYCLLPSAHCLLPTAFGFPAAVLRSDDLIPAITPSCDDKKEAERKCPPRKR